MARFAAAKHLRTVQLARDMGALQLWYSAPRQIAELRILVQPEFLSHAQLLCAVRPGRACPIEPGCEPWRSRPRRVSTYPKPSRRSETSPSPDCADLARRRERHIPSRFGYGGANAVRSCRRPRWQFQILARQQRKKPIGASAALEGDHMALANALAPNPVSCLPGVSAKASRSVSPAWASRIGQQKQRNGTGKQAPP